MGKILGIDLGTSNSCIAIFEAGSPVIICNELGSYLTPSVVRFLSNGDIIVGEHALRASIVDPKNTITGIKRFIGRRYNEVMDLMNTVPFNVVLGNNNLAMIDINSVKYSPQEISAMILQYLENAAEHYCGEKIKDVVITIPAYFNEFQRQATKEAGEIAGLNVLRIINEPTAASLAYGLGKYKDQKIAVFDLGGGTFDITILETGEGVYEVKSVAGDGFLGGDDFDNRIVDWILQEIKRESSINIRNDPLAMQRIREAATNAKSQLSQISEAVINLPFLLRQDNKIINFDLVLTRSKFEELCEELFNKLIRPCNLALKVAGLQPSDINEVLLVGGATRMPKVIDIVRSIFGNEPKKNINPDEAVALGAAIQAGVFTGDIKDVLLLDIFEHTLRIETQGGKTTKLLNKGTTIPTKHAQLFTTMFDNQNSVEINILEGDNELAIHNRSLGRFILEGIQPASKGEPQIEVTIDIDANRIVNVSAKDKFSNKEQSIQITVFTGLSTDKIEHLIYQADRRTDTEKKKKGLFDLKYRLESLIFKAEKLINENREKIPDGDVYEIEHLITKLKKNLESTGGTSIEEALASLKDSYQRLTDAIDVIVKYL